MDCQAVLEKLDEIKRNADCGKVYLNDLDGRGLQLALDDIKEIIDHIEQQLALVG